MVNRLVSADSATGALPAVVVYRQQKMFGFSSTAYSTLQEALTAGAGSVVHVAPGTYNINSTLVIPANTRVRGSYATVNVQNQNATAVSVGDGASIDGLNISGLGSDYVAGDNPKSVGFDVSGKTGVRLTNLLITRVAGASIRALGAKNLAIDKVTIRGVGASTITANDGGPCWGIYLDVLSGSNTTGVQITNTEISDVCQGIIAGIGVTQLTIAFNYIHDVQGQHAMYLQNGTGLCVLGNKIERINYNGIKVQLAQNSPGDSSGTTIANNLVYSTGDNGVILYSTDPALNAKLRNVTVSGNTLDGCARGLFFGSLRGFTVTGNVVKSSGQHGLQFQDCQDGEVNLGSVLEPGRMGLLLSAISNGSNARVHFRGGQIRNPGAASVLNATYGIQYSDGSDITFDGIDISADHGKMDRGILVGSTADQGSSIWRFITVGGATAAAAHFRAGPVAVREFTGNSFSAMINSPANLTTTAAPPAGGAAALPATPLGYATFLIGGVERRVPYYAMA